MLNLEAYFSFILQVVKTASSNLHLIRLPSALCLLLVLLEPELDTPPGLMVMVCLLEPENVKEYSSS